MNATVDRKELAKATKNLLAIVPKKNDYISRSVPTLSYYKIDVVDTGLMITATNLENFAHHLIKFSNNHSEPGSILVESRAFVSAISTSSDKELTIEANDTQVKVGNLQLHTMNVAEFPEEPKMTDKAYLISIPIEALLELYDKIGYAVSTDQTRPTMCGIYLKIYADKMIMVASDGYRLCEAMARVTCQLPQGKTMVEFILRPDVFKVLTQKQGNIEIGIDGEKVWIGENTGLTIVSRLTELPYVQYKKCIPKPKAHPYSLVIDREVLINELHNAKSFVHPYGQLVSFDLTKDEQIIQAQQPDIGIFKTRLSGAYNGEPLKIGFNCRYLTITLRHITKKRVKIELAHSLKCGIIREKTGNIQVVHLLMPIRLD